MQKVPTFENGKAAGAIAKPAGAATGLGGTVSSRRRYAWLCNYHGALSTTELYNPSTGTFSYGPSLNTRRQGHASAMFPNGQVLAVGGWQNVSNPYMGYLASAELFH